MSLDCTQVLSNEPLLMTTLRGARCNSFTIVPRSALPHDRAAMVFEISPLDPRVIVGATLFMGVVALGAAYRPAFRATTVDPRATLAGE